MKKIRRRTQPQSKKNKIFLKIFYFLILVLFILTSILFVFVFRKDTVIKNYTLEQDTTFNFSDSYSPGFYDLIFLINQDSLIDKMIFVKKDNYNSLAFEVDTNLFTTYDSKLYELKNIINAIKQNRIESATKNFLDYLQYSLGLKISNYIYSSDYKNDCNIEHVENCSFYSNNTKYVWQDILTFAKSDNKIYLDKYMFKIDGGINKKLYDNSQNDNLVQNNIKKYSDHIEIYNSTNIQGYGGNISRMYKNSGFEVTRVVNYDKIYSQTTLIIQNQSDNFDLIKNIIGIEKTTKDIPADIISISDYIIILGGDTLQLY